MAFTLEMKPTERQRIYNKFKQAMFEQKDKPELITADGVTFTYCSADFGKGTRDVELSLVPRFDEQKLVFKNTKNNNEEIVVSYEKKKSLLAYWRHRTLRGRLMSHRRRRYVRCGRPMYETKVYIEYSFEYFGRKFKRSVDDPRAILGEVGTCFLNKPFIEKENLNRTLVDYLFMPLLKKGYKIKQAGFSSEEFDVCLRLKKYSFDERRDFELRVNIEVEKETLYIDATKHRLFETEKEENEFSASFDIKDPETPKMIASWVQKTKTKSKKNFLKREKRSINSHLNNLKSDLADRQEEIVSFKDKIKKMYKQIKKNNKNIVKIRSAIIKNKRRLSHIK